MMPASDLRKSILKYAMEGKLVKQNPNDEPASVLLDKIKREKEELIKEGKIKKTKIDTAIYQGEDGYYYEKIGNKETNITEEIPFEIPKTWSYVRFKNIVYFNLGATPDRKTKKYWSNGTIPWISISDMKKNGHIDRTKECITEYAVKDKFSNKLCNPGTLIMSFKLTIGKTSIVDMTCGHNEAIISIYPYYDCNNIIRNYLFKFLPLLTKYVKKTGAIKGDTLNSKIIADMFIPIPPLAEQERITTSICELEPLLDKYEQLIEENENLDNAFSEKLRKSILKYAMRGKLTKLKSNGESTSILINGLQVTKSSLIKDDITREKSEISTIYKGDEKHYFEQTGNKIADITSEVPDCASSNWTMKRLKDLGEFGMGQTILTKDMVKDGVPVYSATIDDKPLGFYPKEKIRIHLNKGDFVIPARGASIGYITYVNDEIATCTQTTIYCKLYEPVFPKFIYYQLISNKDYFFPVSGTAQPQLTISNLTSKIVAFPPLNEQKCIVDKIEILLQKIDEIGNLPL